MPVISVFGWLVATRSNVQYSPQVKQIKDSVSHIRPVSSKKLLKYPKNLGVLAQLLQRGYSQNSRPQ